MPWPLGFSLPRANCGEASITGTVSSPTRDWKSKQLKPKAGAILAVEPRPSERKITSMPSPLLESRLNRSVLSWAEDRLKPGLQRSVPLGVAAQLGQNAI